MLLNQQISICILVLLANIKISYCNQFRDCYPADTCHAIGVDLFYQDMFIESIHFSKAAAKLRLKKNDALLWKSYRNIGTAYFEMQLYQEAKKYFIKAYETAGKKTSSDSVQLIRDLGTSLSELGELEQALEHGRKVILIDPQDPSVQAAYAAILKFTIDSIKLLEAIQHAEMAIQLCQAIENDGYIEEVLIQAISEKGNALNMLGRYNEALEFYNEGLLLISNTDLDYQASMLNNVATVLFEQKKHNLAIQKLNESLYLLFQYNEKTEFSYDYAGDHENLADNYAPLQQFDIALFHYQKALINLTNNFRDENIFHNPNPKDTSLFVYSYPDMIRVLHLKATAFYNYYQQNDSLKYLNLANDCYKSAFDFHDKLQKDISTENSRLFQAKNIVPYLENALNVTYKLQEEEQDIGETAFRYMEKNKATVLLQSMNEADALQFANLPDSLIEEEKDLKIALAYYNKQLNEAIENEEADEIGRIRDLQFVEKQRYDQLIKELEENYPDYHNLKYQQNTDSIADIQKQLNNQKAILEYFVGDSCIFILSIQKDKSNLYKFQKPNDWDTVVDKFLSTFNVDSIHLSHTDEYDPILFNDFTINSSQLFQNLLAQPLKDLGNQITHLQIIPDAKLNYVPFELLLTNNNFSKEQVDYKNLPYLIKEKTISYAYSAALLLEGNHKIKPSYKYKYAGFAPNYDNNEHYLPLNATKGNVTNISNKHGISLVDQEATENNFKDTIHVCQIFQFAGHGDIDDENPLNSKLIFTKTNDSTDYELHAYELYNLEIPAQLGVLSACETGLGKTAKGEGIMSLSRAFTYAGCNSLVMSLWSIYDAQTAEIVEDFFKHLKKGKAKDEALRQAKLDYLQNPETKAGFTHPIYWAGLVQIGDTSPLTFKDNCYCWLLLIAFVLLLTMAWLFLRRKN